MLSLISQVLHHSILGLSTGSCPTAFPLWAPHCANLSSLPSLCILPCHRCGSKLLFRSSTPWVWASGAPHLASYNTFHQNIYRSSAASRPRQLEPGEESGLQEGLVGGCGGVTPACAWTLAETPSLCPGQRHHQHLGWLCHLLRAGLHVSGAGIVPVDQVAKAGGQAAWPWWVEGASGTAGLGK